MSLKRLLVRGGWLLVLAAAARAGIVTDPEMGVEAGDLSQPIGTGVTFSPYPETGGGVFDFYNGTGQVITRFVFQTTFQTSLTPDQLTGVFTCSGDHANPFFLDCSVGYVDLSGSVTLTIAFYGVNPPGDDIDPATIGELGPQKGIPPLLPGCNSTPDAGGCTGTGHFVVTLNDGFATTGAAGGWSPNTNPAMLSLPTFTVEEIDTAPEPSPAMLLAPALLCLAGIAYRGGTFAATGLSSKS